MVRERKTTKKSFPGRPSPRSLAGERGKWDAFSFLFSPLFFLSLFFFLPFPNPLPLFIKNIISKDSARSRTLRGRNGFSVITVFNYTNLYSRDLDSGNTIPLVPTFGEVSIQRADSWPKNAGLNYSIKPTTLC